jgi:hypothetical protein
MLKSQIMPGNIRRQTWRGKHLMSKLTAPYFPIIYVRGYAMTPSEVADTVSTPYLGFNLSVIDI